MESSASAPAGIVCSRTESRWAARAEPAAAVVWASGGRAIMGVFPAAAESPRERKATQGPRKRGERELAALGWLVACFGGGLITKLGRNRTQMSLFLISEC